MYHELQDDVQITWFKNLIPQLRKLRPKEADYLET